MRTVTLDQFSVPVINISTHTEHTQYGRIFKEHDILVDITSCHREFLKHLDALLYDKERRVPITITVINDDYSEVVAISQRQLSRGAYYMGKTIVLKLLVYRLRTSIPVYSTKTDADGFLLKLLSKLDQ